MFAFGQPTAVALFLTWKWFLKHTVWLPVWSFSKQLLIRHHARSASVYRVSGEARDDVFSVSYSIIIYRCASPAMRF